MSSMGYGINRKIKQIGYGLLIVSSFLEYGWSQNVTEVVNLIRSGEIQKAKSLVMKFDEQEKSKPNTLFLLGLLSSNGDSSAIFYNQLINHFPNSKYCDDALFRLAQLQYARGLYKSALSQFRKMLSDYPQSPLKSNCQYWIGLCHQAMNQPDSASQYLQRVQPDSQKMEDLNLTQNHTQPLQTTMQPTGQYHIQTGAFTHQANALMRKSFFESKGYQVDLRTKSREGITYYLVWVGSFNEKADAEVVGEQLKSQLGVQYQIVSE